MNRNGKARNIVIDCSIQHSNRKIHQYFYLLELRNILQLLEFHKWAHTFSASKFDNL